MLIVTHLSIIWFFKLWAFSCLTNLDGCPRERLAIPLLTIPIAVYFKREILHIMEIGYLERMALRVCPHKLDDGKPGLRQLGTYAFNSKKRSSLTLTESSALRM